jgi:hypothetical protein
MQLLPLLVKITPTNFRSWLAKIAPSKRVQKIRDIVNIMDQTSVEVFKAKKVALQQDDDGLSKDFGKGKDIMTILCAFIALSALYIYADNDLRAVKANMDAAPESRLGETELIGQVTCAISISTMAISTTNFRLKDPDICVRDLTIFLGTPLLSEHNQRHGYHIQRSGPNSAPLGTTSSYPTQTPD